MADTYGINPNAQQGIPWEQILANRRQITPEEVFTALTQYMQQTQGGARRDMAGFIQKPTQSQQLAEENAVWEAKFPANRQALAIEKEQTAFGNRLPSFTQQEMTRRGQTPQERINVAMGPGWATMDPTQRRTILQSRVGQVPDFVNPLTGVGPTSLQVTAGGPSMINGMPAQQAIAQATQQANEAQAAAPRPSRRQDQAQSTKFRKRSKVTRMF